MSKKDAMWIGIAFERLFPGEKLNDISPERFYEKAKESEQRLADQGNQNWLIPGLTRDPATHLFKDDDLVAILNTATNEPAGAFGAFGSPSALRVVEILGQKRARMQNVCTMNEFRSYLGLTPFKTFEEWAGPKQQKAAEAARALYNDQIDDLELYPGLLAEECKPSMAGSGTCTGHTIGRGILDDAVSLIVRLVLSLQFSTWLTAIHLFFQRSDRFLTHDFNTSTLTSWGAASLKVTPGSPNGYLAALLFDAFPFSYKFNSTYALLPFYTPPVAKKIFKDLKLDNQYEFTEQDKATPLLSLQSYKACEKAFNDRDKFATLYNDSIKQITGGRGFFIGFDAAAQHDPMEIYMRKAFYGLGNEFESKVHRYVSKCVEYQVKRRSLPYHGSKTRQLDIVRDVTNIVAIKWIAQRFALPIKTARTPQGLFTIDQLRQMLLGLFIFSSMNVVPKAGWVLRETSLKSATLLTGLIKFRIATSKKLRHLMLDWAAKGSALQDTKDSEEFYQALLATGKSHDQMAGDALGVMIPIAGNLTQQVSLLVELYLRDEYRTDRDKLAEICMQGKNDNTDAQILKYCLEGMRIAPIVVGLPRRATQSMEIKDGGRNVKIKDGDKVIIGISKAHMDPAKFRNPTEIDVTRPDSDYILLGHGMHKCFGDRISDAFLVASMRAIFRLDNLRKDPSPTGSFKRVRNDFAGGLDSYSYLDQNACETPSANSLTVLWDAERPSDACGRPAVASFSFE
ncbi:hypothetical protein P7C70_g6725, partial [Phenoliferia sp. Uapishka_3]